MVLGEVRKHLAAHLSPRAALVGVGNVMYGDDGFGPHLVRRLRNRTAVALFEAGVAPENITGPIRRLRPETVIIADAVRRDGPAGSLCWLAPDDLASQAALTHGPSLEIFLAFLAQLLPAAIHVLGMVPAETGFGRMLSEPAERCLAELVGCIAELCPAAGRDERT